MATASDSGARSPAHLSANFGGCHARRAFPFGWMINVPVFKDASQRAENCPTVSRTRVPQALSHRASTLKTPVTVILDRFGHPPELGRYCCSSPEGDASVTEISSSIGLQIAGHQGDQTGDQEYLVKHLTRWFN